MPRGQRIPPGPSLYPTCGKRGRTGIERHYRDGTVSCQPCRDEHARRVNWYKLRRGDRGNLVIDACGTRRRLQALSALGWRGVDLEPLLKIEYRTVSRVAKAKRVTVGTAERVAAVYDRLSMTQGPSATTRRRALAKGWLVPMEWDDDLIDDPRHVPHAIVMRDWATALEENRERRKRGAPSSDNDARGWNTKIIESDYEEWTAA